MDERSNPRKFKLWDTAALTNAMYEAAEIRHKLERSCETKGVDISELDPTLINSEILYDVTLAYLASYEALMQEDLIHRSSKLKPTIH